MPPPCRGPRRDRHRHPTGAPTCPKRAWSLDGPMAGPEAPVALLHGRGTMTLEARVVVPDPGGTGDPDGGFHRTSPVSLVEETWGQAAAFELNVSYIEALDPVGVAGLRPKDCVARNRGRSREDTKIHPSAPGSTEIRRRGRAKILDQIAREPARLPAIVCGWRSAGHTGQPGPRRDGTSTSSQSAGRPPC